MPTAEIAIVIGASTAQNGTGAATSSSSSPTRRRWARAAADAVVVSDQIPIIAEPMAAPASVCPSLPPRNRKYAIVA